jgi:hypothetical protein
MSTSEYLLPEKLGKLFSVMAEDYGRKGNVLLRDLLQRSEYSVEEDTFFDNWNTGAFGHSVHFQAPGDIYFEIIDSLADVATELAERVNQLKTVSNEFIDSITIEIKDEPAKPGQETDMPEDAESSQIPESIRRDIIDHIRIEGIDWSGRLDDSEFLERIYDLYSMKSYDSRFPDAANDIWQHRVNNPNDWEDDWIFSDARFNLLHTSDAEFLRFLCEMLHPVARSDAEEVTRMQESFNRMLGPTGWQILPAKHIGDRPVMAPKHGNGVHRSEAAPDSLPVPTAATELDRLWGLPGYFRVFLSHKAEF